MKRIAYAKWIGTVKEGKGELTTQSGILDKTNYSFKTRFVGDERGTNPEELLAAAHAGCFTMAVSFALTERGIQPEVLHTTATLTMEGFDIVGIHLNIAGTVAGLEEEDFELITKEAEKNCLISKTLKIAISSESKLMS